MRNNQGYNNTFQVNSKSALALVYNDKSVLENMHASVGFEYLMGKNKTPELDILEGFSKEHALAIRNTVIKVVLQTDMTFHFEKVNQLKGLVMEEEEQNESKLGDSCASLDSTDSSNSNLKGDIILGFLLHAADISNCAKPAPVFEQWTDRCLNEFFRQGDKERSLRLPISPLCDRKTTNRADSQIGFIKYVILPTFELLGKIIPDVATHVVPTIQDNLAFWQREKSLEEVSPKATETGSQITPPGEVDVKDVKDDSADASDNLDEIPPRKKAKTAS